MVRILGYCTVCKRIKQVRASAPWIPGIPQGVCDACAARKAS